MWNKHTHDRKRDKNLQWLEIYDMKLSRFFENV